ncbi:hypothetical protein J0871_16440 [Salegentibacter sp. BDJ18]|uniref:hypothetical protein n=1 Tax=Salegentibacter sp. BDJ18 TaxID=2816376 RepID=UPI001AAF8365|nr:hypothetical protein [Salegentibacter sp. BDJ18]MBO2546007.1 hypothetical protein [Salegentibacter sp. BDJ18]
MKKKALTLIIIFLATLPVLGQGDSNRETPRKIIHYNIKIVSDLSNRLDNELYPRQLDDKEIINTILQVFPDLLTNYNRLALQKDKISYTLLNPLEIRNYNELKDDLTIDLGEFGTNQFQRIDFIKNRKSPTLNESIVSFNSKISEIYKSPLERGSFYTADTWGFFKQVIDENYFKLTNPINSIKAKDVSRNVIILLTDGFIELAARNSPNSCPEKTCDLLNTHQIEKFRKYYNSLENRISIEEAFEQSGYGLKPVNNPNLKDLEVLMLEFNGRSKTVSGRITKTPTDFEILKLFWEDFLKNEGVKKVAIKKTQPSTDNINQIVKEFLEE